MVALHVYYSDQKLVDQLSDKLSLDGYSCELAESEDTYLLLNISDGEGIVELFSTPAVEPQGDKDFEIHLLLHPESYDKAGDLLLDKLSQFLKDNGCLFVKNHNEF